MPSTLKFPVIVAINVLIALLSWTGIANAKAAESSVGLRFDLPSVESTYSPTESSIESLSEPADDLEIGTETASLAPLPVPLSAIPIAEPLADIDIAPPVPIAPPAPVDTLSARLEESNSDDIGLAFAAHDITLPTATDTASDTQPMSDVLDNSDLISSAQTEQSGLDWGLESANASATPPSQSVTLMTSSGLTSNPDEDTSSDAQSSPDNDIALNFETAFSPAVLDVDISLDSSELSSLSASVPSLQFGDWMFENGSDSLVARTVGSAEGTRHWDGSRTRAYYGHVDPGNGVWNLGTFSYQHTASSPEDADERQLQRLQRQGQALLEQAANFGIELSLEEQLNGLDLANQAPLAALDRGGYIERLAQARRLNMEGQEAILWARTHSYIDPDTRRWNAPGLGNNVHSISRDQERRMDAISKAFSAFDPSNAQNIALDDLEQISLSATGEEAPKAAAEQGETLATVYVGMELSFTLPPSSDPSTDSPAVAPAENQTEETDVATALSVDTLRTDTDLEDTNTAPENTEHTSTDNSRADTVSVDSERPEDTAQPSATEDVSDSAVSGTLGEDSGDSATTETAETHSHDTRTASTASSDEADSSELFELNPDNESAEELTAPEGDEVAMAESPLQRVAPAENQNQPASAWERLVGGIIPRDTGSDASQLTHTEDKIVTPEDQSDTE